MNTNRVPGPRGKGQSQQMGKGAGFTVGLPSDTWASLRPFAPSAGLFGWFGLLLLLFAGGPNAAPPSDSIHHDLVVRIDPQAGRIEVEDAILLAHPVEELEFLLHGGLDPRALGQGVELSLKAKEEEGAVPVERYRVHFQSPSRNLLLAYGGIIRHDLERQAQGYGETHQVTSGRIAPEGVFLDRASLWYPVLGEAPLSFTLGVGLPDGWRAISQGKGDPQLPNRWSESAPQDDIYLVAGQYTVYRRPGAAVEAQVWLRQPDEPLANRYLDATERYLKLYGDLIGPYPYAKFATVENFWETGYGMPSFTLLGPAVLRLPFILQSSFPHEVLHNWWGNGVYVDYERGNWSEGLTSYLADHLLQEQAGQGAAYRRDALQRYGDYVKESQDFPLKEFRGRHGQRSQAIGYGKAMMLFHMLRQRLGEEGFRDGLRRFYADNRFRVAGYAELRRAFEAVTGQSLGEEFDQWVERTGAPRLELGEVRVEENPGGFALTGLLRQIQGGEPYRLRVPLRVGLAGEQEMVRSELSVDQKEQPFRLEFDRHPTELRVDPEFDLFRRLAPGETPSSLARLFAAERVTLVLPRDETPERLAGYRALAEQWAEAQPGLQIETEENGLPSSEAVWLLGRNNRLAARLFDRVETVKRLEQGMVIGGQNQPWEGRSFVLTIGQGSRTIAWLVADPPQAIPGLARKLPHYGKYSYLVFTGEAPDRLLQGQWPVSGEGLRWVDGGR